MTAEGPAPAGRATLAGFAAICLWSTLAVLTLGTAGMPPFLLLALGFGIGGLLGLALLVRPGGAGLQALRQPPQAFLLTTASLFGYHALYFIALKSAPVVQANLINYLWPLLIVVFAALLLRQRVAGRQWLGVLTGLAGAILIVTGGARIGIDPAHLPGYLAALGAAVTWGIYSVLNRRFAQVPSATIAGPCLVVSVLGAICHVVLENGIAWDVRTAAIVLAMGLGPVGIAFWLWDIGTKRGSLPVLGNLAYATPLLSTLWLLIAGAATPHWSQAVACLLIITGGLLGTANVRAPRR
ncbi:aromatic amino acid exporter YddG [Pseudofulvimonas gallinarii]|uniref:EamA domain-containing membrane protein RarD n=1 Tax=Pseudofulvimonas gallinarii TaxID=634155 RepID=A0A4R3LPA0_9GAMM|nr:EamA family transporter [Pseudofulvimonas gallinarii]TCT01329.1 EamA domain-containing membrane protein RarD [Pseudofulvimonas gallinarii]